MTGTWEVSEGTVHESGAGMCTPSSNRDDHVSPASAGSACPGRQGASSDMPHMTAHAHEPTIIHSEEAHSECRPRSTSLSTHTHWSTACASDIKSFALQLRKLLVKRDERRPPAPDQGYTGACFASCGKQRAACKPYSSISRSHVGGKGETDVGASWKTQLALALKIV